MNNVGYVVLSRQAGIARELVGIANNIANADTAGFRSEGFLFSEYVRRLEPHDRSLSQTNAAGRYFDPVHGALVETGGVFDVALETDGFFVVETPRGERLTRAGSFLLNAEGLLSTPEGYAVLGEGGSPISLPPESANIVIAPDGAIAADGAPVARLSVVTAPPTALAREGDKLFRLEGEPEPAADIRVRQGFVEDSTVNPVVEIARLIEIQRAYELNQQLLRDDDERISRTIESARLR